MKTNKLLPPLIFCLLMDLIGCASFTIPFIDEFSDVIWRHYLPSYFIKPLEAEWEFSAEPLAF